MRILFCTFIRRHEYLKFGNMKLGKWIGGALGFVAMGPLGALAGYFIGRLFDTASDLESGSSSSPEAEAQGQRNSFLFSLLVMASYVIRADRRIMHSEMEFVRNFLRTRFGEGAVVEGEQILLHLFEEAKKQDAENPGGYRQLIADCGAQIAANMSYSQRLQLLSFLVQIAQSDGRVCSDEIAALREVTQDLGLSAGELDSLLHLRGDSLEEAYQVLELSPSATDEEVKAAYRRLALKHHPDRVATLGEDVRRAAEEKFQQINNAKERIYKARGMK